jgi:hypothetical protein
MSNKNYKFMTNKLKVLRRNPNGVVTFILVIEALSFANWSSVPMCRNPTLGLSVRMKLTLPKLGMWSPPGLPNVCKQRVDMYGEIKYWLNQMTTYLWF